jgi:hypothetical protein
MTDKQPEALRLADLLDYAVGIEGYVRDEAAAELRRLHEVNAELVLLLEDWMDTFSEYAEEGDASLVVFTQEAITKATGEQQ